MVPNVLIISGVMPCKFIKDELHEPSPWSRIAEQCCIYRLGSGSELWNQSRYIRSCPSATVRSHCIEDRWRSVEIGWCEERSIGIVRLSVRLRIQVSEESRESSCMP